MLLINYAKMWFMRVPSSSMTSWANSPIGLRWSQAEGRQGRRGDQTEANVLYNELSLALFLSTVRNWNSLVARPTCMLVFDASRVGSSPSTLPTKCSLISMPDQLRASATKVAKDILVATTILRHSAYPCRVACVGAFRWAQLVGLMSSGRGG